MNVAWTADRPAYTYNSLRELARPVVVFASSTTELEAALEVLADALMDSGVFNYEPERCSRAFARTRALEWALRWAMRAVYGSLRISEPMLKVYTKNVHVRRLYPISIVSPESRKEVFSHRGWTEGLIGDRAKGLRRKVLKVHCAHCRKPIEVRFELCFRCLKHQQAEHEARLSILLSGLSPSDFVPGTFIEINFAATQRSDQ